MTIAWLSIAAALFAPVLTWMIESRLRARATVDAAVPAGKVSSA